MAEKTETKYSVGDRVKVRSGKNHDEMTKDKAGEIVEISTPALGIKFDGMDSVHKWYVDDEVEPDGDAKSGDDAKKKDKMPGMSASKALNAESIYQQRRAAASPL